MHLSKNGSSWDRRPIHSDHENYTNTNPYLLKWSWSWPHKERSCLLLPTSDLEGDDRLDVDVVVMFQVAKLSCRLIFNQWKQKQSWQASTENHYELLVSDLDVLCKCHVLWLFVPWWQCTHNVFLILHRTVERGKTINNHLGNQFLHQEKKGLREEYLAAKRSVKQAIAQRLVNSVHTRGGRFLKKKDGKWQKIKKEASLGEMCTSPAYSGATYTRTQRSTHLL